MCFPCSLFFSFVLCATFFQIFHFILSLSLSSHLCCSLTLQSTGRGSLSLALWDGASWPPCHLTLVSPIQCRARWKCLTSACPALLPFGWESPPWLPSSRGGNKCALDSHVAAANCWLGSWYPWLTGWAFRGGCRPPKRLSLYLQGSLHQPAFLPPHHRARHRRISSSEHHINAPPFGEATQGLGASTCALAQGLVAQTTLSIWWAQWWVEFLPLLGPVIRHHPPPHAPQGCHLLDWQ